MNRVVELNYPRTLRLRLDESRVRIRHHRTTEYERVFAEMIRELKRGAEVAAERLRERLRKLKGDCD